MISNTLNTELMVGLLARICRRPEILHDVEPRTETEEIDLR
jgi:hypothetical protein